MTIRKYLEHMIRDNGQIELRCISSAIGIWYGIFDNMSKFIAQARRANRSGKFDGVYALLNQARQRTCRNVLQRASKTTRDSDITRMTRLVFDIDPVRPKGESSTSNELAASRSVCMQLRMFLRDRGFPDPLVAMSGSGYHLQYRTSLVLDDSDHGGALVVRDVLSRMYGALRPLFSDAQSDFDVTVRNPSRIFKLYGTTARKGTATHDRPHRRSVCMTPEPWLAVDCSSILRVADEISPVIAQPVRTAKPIAVGRRSAGWFSNGDFDTLDVVSWFTAHGNYKRCIAGNKHAVTCPWLSSHSSADTPHRTDTVVWQAGPGWPEFHCSHAHCAGKSIRDVVSVWRDAEHFCARRLNSVTQQK